MKKRGVVFYGGAGPLEAPAYTKYKILKMKRDLRCARCGKKFSMSKYARTIPRYCGSYNKQEGCAYIVKKEQMKQWRDSHPNYQKQWLEARPDYTLDYQKERYTRFMFYKKFYEQHKNHVCP